MNQKTPPLKRAQQLFLHWSKEVLKRTPIYPPVINAYDRYAHKKWLASGRPVPPPGIVKAEAIREYATKHGIDTMIETGTFRGDTIYTLRNAFRKIYTIELSDVLYRQAVRRFRRNPNVNLLHGDSGKVMAKLLSEVNDRCIFWLDGHYATTSEGLFAKGESTTPIFDELRAILAHRVKDHVILIDDARLFISGEDDYPPLDSVRKLILEQRPSYAIEVKDDIIRAYPA